MAPFAGRFAYEMWVLPGSHTSRYEAITADLAAELAGTMKRVLRALDASGIASNTIVIFTSDNGGERFSKVWPFSGMKQELLEGGIRVPAIEKREVAQAAEAEGGTGPG